MWTMKQLIDWMVVTRTIIIDPTGGREGSDGHLKVSCKQCSASPKAYQDMSK